MTRFAEGVFVVAALAGAEAYAGTNPALAGRSESFAEQVCPDDAVQASAAAPGLRVSDLPTILPALRPTIARTHGLHRTHVGCTDHAPHDSPVQKRLHPGVLRHHT